MKSRERRGFTQKEISDALNNAVVKTLRPLSLEEIPDARLRNLHNYAHAMVEACFEHVEEGLLRSEELVAILTAGALYVQASYVMNTDKIPMAKKSEELFTA